MAMSPKGRERSGAPNRMMLRRTLFLLSVCGAAAFVVLAARLYYLQIVRHDELEARAIAQQVRETTVSAPRGTIYDRKGEVLAVSAGVDTIYLSPAEIELYGEDAGAIAAGLSEILGLDYESVYEKTQNTGSWYEVVARKVEADTAEAVRQFKQAGGYNGIKLEADTKRYYPNGSLAAHVIGFVGTDNTGLGGIEAKYDKALSGTNGFIMRSTTAAGTDMLYTSWEDYFDAVPGEDVELTIDSGIQYYVEKHLAQAVEDYDIQNGAAAICMEVDTGAILAMASLGNFDLNDYQTISDEAMAEIDATAMSDEERSEMIAAAQQLQWRNKAISDTYEPGSTFKIITLAMALEEGVVDLDSTFYCGGSVSVPGRNTPVRCWKSGGHGSQTLTQAVQHSCNVAFVNIGLRVGAERFYDYAEAFGFFDRGSDSSVQLTGTTGIDLGGESGSIWWSEDVFSNPDNLSQLAAASFGQTFNITPIQLITAVSACVNGGYLMQPYLVESVTGLDGQVQEHESEPVRQVISEETSAKARAILEQVVGDPNEGTGRNAYVAGYRIGGKTGTSTKTTQEIAGTKEYIVSFLGVAPADDPQIALLVLLDNPSSESGIYVSGGQMAAPVVGKMLADILPYMGIEPEYSDTELMAMDRAAPDVTGLSLDEARAKLSDSSLSWRVVGSGNTVTSQLPAANSVIASGSEVLLYADASPSGGGSVPNLTGMTYAEARQALSQLGMFVSSDSSVTDASGQLVSGQSVNAGTAAPAGTVVTVTLYDNDEDLLGIY
ncbi:MAG TPA: PASTA domain-containing protein [Candidatus Scatomorpha merdigallinarum]|nr:PASTA domain-containing protein [Candidatus Scatomorpha merdigallinarum]